MTSYNNGRRKEREQMVKGRGNNSGYSMAKQPTLSTGGTCRNSTVPVTRSELWTTDSHYTGDKRLRVGSMEERESEKKKDGQWGESKPFNLSSL